MALKINYFCVIYNKTKTKFLLLILPFIFENSASMLAGPKYFAICPLVDSPQSNTTLVDGLTDTNILLMFRVSEGAELPVPSMITRG